MQYRRLHRVRWWGPKQRGALVTHPAPVLGCKYALQNDCIYVDVLVERLTGALICVAADLPVTFKSP